LPNTLESLRNRAIPFLCTLALVGTPRATGAQEPPPIPRVVVDLHGVLAGFPDDEALALSRGLSLAELAGRGLGGAFGVHVYPFRFRAITFGFGGRLASLRASQDPGPQAAPGSVRPVSERLTSLGPQLSFNFGTGAGWSYLSGGISGSTWSVVADGSLPLPPDRERLKTIDYGGGARWFAKPHLAFSFDLRFYAVNPRSPGAGLPGGPRTTLFVVGAGVSLK
jgi:hypothetical protein